MSVARTARRRRKQFAKDPRYAKHLKRGAMVKGKKQKGLIS